MASGNEMNRLSVVIPSKNLENLIPCIKAVRKHEPQVRIIWIDDLGDQRHEQAHEFVASAAGLHNFWSLEGEKPFIFARNVNIGIKAAGDDDVVILNDDALLETPNGFSAMQTAAESHQQFGIIGAVTNVTGQPLQQPRNIGLREVPHFAFVCVLIPRRTIERIGALDERYCIDYGVEDLDYCESTRRAGLKCGVFDHCFVNHAQLVSTFRGQPHTPKTFEQNYRLFQ